MMTQRIDGEGYTLYQGDCLAVLPGLAAGSVDAVICDPPYPMIKRDYGMMTESAWMEMMQEIVRQTRRILNPTGSAVFILQPNSEKVGRMRLWLWEFMVWAGREWGIVQDAYWWNYNAMPEAHAIQGRLMRPSVKPCIWLGSPDCYRDQDAVLWSQAQGGSMARFYNRFSRSNSPSGQGIDKLRAQQAIAQRGGVTPFNMFPIPNADSANGAGSFGHGAGTPLKLADWWTRYICPPGGTACDPFCGTGTMGLAALQNGCSFVGIEKMPKYYETARQRLDAARAAQG